MLVALTDHWVCMHHSDELALASWCVFICTVVLACPCGLSHDDGDAHIVFYLAPAAGLGCRSILFCSNLSSCSLIVSCCCVVTPWPPCSCKLHMYALAVETCCVFSCACMHCCIPKLAVHMTVVFG